MRQRLNELQKDECLTTGDHWKEKMANIDLKNKARWAKERNDFYTEKIQERMRKIEDADAKIK